MTAHHGHKIDMLNGPMAGKMLLYALPLAATGILQQLFNAADVAVVGQFVSPEAMASVGSNGPIVGLMVNLFVGISLGANVTCAFYTGQGNKEGVSKVVHTSLLFAFICGVCMAVAGQFFAGQLLHLMGVPQEVYPMALLYLRIYMAGLPAIFLYNFASAIFRSQGDTRTPLIVLAVSGVLNVALNLFFVLSLHMSSDGVALATIIANLISSVILIFLLSKRRDLIRFEFKKLKIYPDALKRVLKIGVPSGCQGMVFSISNMCIQSAINSLGPVVMAASAAAFNIEIFPYYMLNAFGQACATFISQNHGAGNEPRCKRTILVSLGLNEIATVGLALTLVALAQPLLMLFNPDPVIISYGMIRLTYILTAQALNVVIEIMSNALRGYGHSLSPAIISFICICGVRIMWVFTAFRETPTFDTLLTAYPISWVCAACALAINYFVFRKRMQQGKVRNI